MGVGREANDQDDARSTSDFRVVDCVGYVGAIDEKMMVSLGFGIFLDKIRQMYNVLERNIKHHSWCFLGGIDSLDSVEEETRQ